MLYSLKVFAQTIICQNDSLSKARLFSALNVDQFSEVEGNEKYPLLVETSTLTNQK